MRTRARRALLWGPLAVLALVLALFFAPLAAPGRAFVFRDLLVYEAGQDAILRESLLERHELPARNPYAYLGVPHLADPCTQSLYPPRLVTALLFSPPRSLDVAIVLHFCLAAAGAWRLARALGAGRAASVAGAACYALSGPVLSLQENLPLLAGATWLPWVWALALEGRLALTALALALTVLGGDLQSATWAAALVLAMPWLSFSRAAGAPPTGGLVDASRRSLVPVALGLALAAVLLVPAARLRPLTDRAKPLPEATAGAWRLAPVRALELALPFPTGVTFPEGESVTAGLAPEPRVTEPWCETLHVGLVGLVLGLAALAEPRRRGVRLGLLGLAAAGFVLALGPLTPAWSILRGIVPFYGVFRYPEKHAVLVALGLAPLAALGVEALRAEAARRRAALALVGTGLVLALGFLAAEGSLATSIARATLAVKGDGPRAQELATKLASALRVQALVATATLLASGAALALVRRRRRLALAVAALLVAANVPLATWPRLFLGDASLYEARPVGAEVVAATPPALQGRLLRWPWPVWGNVGHRDPGPSPEHPRRSRERAQEARVRSWTGLVAARERVPAVQGFSSFVPLALRDALPEGADLPDAATLDRLGVRWLVIDAGLAEKQGLVPVARASSGAVLVDRGERPVLPPDLGFQGEVPGLGLGALVSLGALGVLVALARGPSRGVSRRR